MTNLERAIKDGYAHSSSQYVRDFILERFQLLAVVSLPQCAFAHFGAGVKASVIFVRKRGNDEVANNEEVIFMAAPELIGYDATGRKTESQLDEIVGALYPTTDIVNTYVFRALKEGALEKSSAVNLFQSAMGLMLVSVDINRGENDTFQIQLGPQTSGKCQIQLRIKAGGGICYEIVMDQPGWSFASNKSASSAGSDGPVYYENALELLDEPGEWYINDDSKVLYYMPRVWEDMEEVVFTIPIIDGELLTISGSDYEHMVHNICFRGITFADTTWTRPSTTSGHSDTQNNHIREGGDTLPDAAIVVSKANGVCFEECTFTRLGITAVKMIEAIVKTKGVEKICLISDSMPSRGNFKNNESEGIWYGSDLNYDDEGHLAGSRMTLDNGVRNMMTHTGYGLCHAIRMATLNPARLLGIDYKVGSLETGKIANLILIDDAVHVDKVFLYGELAVNNNEVLV